MFLLSPSHSSFISAVMVAKESSIDVFFSFEKVDLERLYLTWGCGIMLSLDLKSNLCFNTTHGFLWALEWNV